MTPFARAIRRARDVQGWTQEQLSTRLEVTQATVSYWEGGVEYPSFEHLARLIGLVPEVLPFAHQEELELVRRLMHAERLAFPEGCACQGTCVSG